MAEITGAPGNLHRDADDGIYLNEDRRKQPKEIFKQIGDRMAAEQRPAGTRVLDAGCATGELLDYLQSRFGEFRFAGFDISENLIAVARERLRGATFHIASLTDPDPTAGETFDVVTCSGVLGIFDEAGDVVKRLMQMLNPGGTLIVAGPFNEEPVDVLVRYRPAETPAAPWQSGWNVVSKKTMENVLRGIDSGITIAWHPFRMPFAIPKSDDPMRSWTIKTADDPFQQTNGVGQLRKVFIMQARRSDD